MTSRYDATMNGVALSSLHDGLMVLDIQYTAPEPEHATAQPATRNGLYITNTRLREATVTVLFELHIYSTTARQSVCQEIAAWAAGGMLETSDRPGQMLLCRCKRPPVINSAKGWTEALSVVFTAYAVPFWQDKTATQKTVTGSDSLTVPGNVPADWGRAAVDVTVTAGTTINSITLHAGNTYITLSAVNVPANGVIEITHDENGILSIKYEGSSLLGNRSGSDDLLLPCGESSNVSVSTSSSVSAVFSVRGLWL